MQDRNDCRQGLPDFQEVQVFWTFFPQLLFFRMGTSGSLDGNIRGYNRALTQAGAARQPRPVSQALAQLTRRVNVSIVSAICPSSINASGTTAEHCLLLGGNMPI